MKRLLAAVLAVLIVTACSGGSRDLSITAPDFVLPAVDGTMVQLSDYKGKVIIIDFWTTWCAPCQEQVPILTKLHKSYSEKGLVILGISLDVEGLEVLGPFVHENMVPYKVLMSDDRVNRAFGGIATIPTLYIVDRNGRLVRKLIGFHNYRDLEDEIKRYL
jgi:cytochrome c biogenesis protein CcmG/thiol:disulfide interchange protein DsbE